MSVNSLLDKLENIVAGAWRIPMTKGKCAVSAEEIQNLIDDIRLELPKEIKQAKIIVEDRNNILSDAKEQAKNILHNADKQAKYMVSDTNIFKQTKRASNRMISDAREKTDRMKNQVEDFIIDIVTKVEETLISTTKNFKSSSNEIKKVIRKNKSKF